MGLLDQTPPILEKANLLNKMAASLRMDFRPPLIIIFILLIDTVYHVGTGVSTVNITLNAKDVDES